MKQILLDTSFILTCAKQKIDFFEELEHQGFQIIIPKQVLVEIKGLAKSNPNAELVLKILLKNNFKLIDLKSKNTDKAIMNYSKKNKKVIIATLDSDLKKKIKANKLIIRGKKKLEIV